MFRESEREGVKQVAPSAGWLIIVRTRGAAVTPAPRKRLRRPLPVGVGAGFC